MSIKFEITGASVELDVADDTPLLWAVRDELDLKGTKFGCGIGLCGACTVHVDGVAQRSCITPLASVAGSNITTIEGLSENGDHPLQQAWIEAQTPQCGYCQSGQIMSAVALLEQNANPDDAAINAAMSGNICRCGMYGRIRKAIKRAAGESVVGVFYPKANAPQEASNV